MFYSNTAHGQDLSGKQLPPLLKGSRFKFPEIKLLNGKRLPASYFQDKVVIIQRWASWCPFCARQNPNLNALHIENKARGLEVLCVSVDKTPEAAKRYMTEKGYQFHVAMMTVELQKALGRSKTLPEVWVIGRDGTLKDYIPGEMFPEDVEELNKWLSKS